MRWRHSNIISAAQLATGKNSPPIRDHDVGSNEVLGPAHCAPSPSIKVSHADAATLAIVEQYSGAKTTQPAEKRGVAISLHASVRNHNALPPRDYKNSINTAAMKPRYLLLAQRRSILLGNTLSRVVAATTDRHAAIKTFPCIFMAAQRRFNPAIHRRRDVTPAFAGYNHNILTRRKGGGVLGPANGVRPSNAANPQHCPVQNDISTASGGKILLTADTTKAPRLHAFACRGRRAEMGTWGPLLRSPELRRDLGLSP